MKSTPLALPRKCPISRCQTVAPRVQLQKAHRSRGLPPPWARCGAFFFVALVLTPLAPLTSGCAKPRPAITRARASEKPEIAGGPFSAKLRSEHPLVGTIYSPSRHAFISRQTLEEDLRSAHYILLGEKHDAPDHHRLQREMLAAVVAKQPALVLEMIDVDAQEGITNQGTLAPLAPGWDWPLYQPIVDLARANKLPVLAGNYPRAKIKASFHGTPIPESERARFGLDLPLPERESLENELIASHCGKLPKEHLPAFIDAQRLRDAQMAERMTSDPHGAVLIAGNGHTRKDRGVPWVLRTRDKNAKIFSLAFIEVEATVTKPEGEKFPYDAVWFTPALADDDPCGPHS